MGDRQGEDGISEVVGFVFILALLVTGLSIYLAYGVPVQGREDEIKEMDVVRGWFVDYKTGLDRLWMTSPGLSSDPDEFMAFNTTVGDVTLVKTLDPGTAKAPGFLRRYLPMLSPIKSSGMISVTDLGETLTIEAARGATHYSLQPIPARALVYTSHNNYWLQQEYSYQLGGVFLQQWDGPEGRNVSAVTAPPLSIHPYTEPATLGVSRARVTLTVVNLSDVVVSGIGSSSPVRVESGLQHEPTVESPDGSTTGQRYDNVSITFHARDPETARAWERVFAGAARRNGLRMNAGPESWCNTTLAGNDARIDVTGPPAAGGGDVSVDLLVADYAMRLSNVPTMIE